MSWLDDLLNGRDPNGSSGFNVANTLAQSRSGQDDPRLRNLFSWQPTENSNVGMYGDSTNQRLDNQGNVDGDWVQVGNFDLNSDYFKNKDKGSFKYDPEFGLLTRRSNMNVPESMLDRYMPAIVTAAVMGPALAHQGLLGGAAAGEETAAVRPDSYWNMVADGGNVANDAAPGLLGEGAPGYANEAGAFTQNLGPGGGLDPETWAGNGGMGVSQNGIGPGSLLDRIAGTVNNPGSLMSSNGLLANAAGGAASYAMDNPIRSLLLANTARNALSRGNTPSSSSSTPKGGGGTPIQMGTKRGEYKPNPITLAQLMNFKFTQPGGH